MPPQRTVCLYIVEGRAQISIDLYVFKNNEITLFS